MIKVKKWIHNVHGVLNPIEAYLNLDNVLSIEKRVPNMYGEKGYECTMQNGERFFVDMTQEELEKL